MSSLALLTAPSPHHHPLPVVSGAEGGGKETSAAADKPVAMAPSASGTGVVAGKRRKFQKKPLKRAREDEKVFLTGSETDDEAEPAKAKKRRKIIVNKETKERKKGRRGKKRTVRKPDNEEKGDNSSSDTGNAPFNTTQFLMADHGDTIQYLDAELGVGGVNPAPVGAPHNHLQRVRQRSLSQEDGEDTADLYYSSPDDEGDFLSGEFLRDYNNVRADRLVTMTKTELIGEYISMEARIDSLEKRLQKARQREDARRAAQRENEGEVDEDDEPGFDFERLEFPMSPEVAEKIRVFQREIHGITLENNKLKSENRKLRRAKNGKRDRKVSDSEDEDAASSASDVSSSSGSSSSSSDSSSSDSSDEEEVGQDAMESNEASVAQRSGEGPDFADDTAQDTGYESGQSGNLTATTKTAIPTSKLAAQPGSEDVVTSTS